jgi:transcriptional regulator with XRE-family HTH domain
MTQNLRQKDLAFLMELDSTQISRWEQGRQVPSGYYAVGLAVATGRLVEEMFFDYRKEWQKRISAREKLLNCRSEGKANISTVDDGKAKKNSTNR